MGLFSRFFQAKPKSQAEPMPRNAPEAAEPVGGQALRSWVRALDQLPPQESTEIASGTMLLTVISSEELYSKDIAKGIDTPTSRETFVVHNLLSNLLGGGYPGFLGLHALAAYHAVNGYTWRPKTQDEFKAIGDMAAVIALHEDYRGAEEHMRHEAEILARPGDRFQEQSRVVSHLIREEDWETTCVVMQGTMQTLSRNLLDAWSSPEQYEAHVYRTLVAALRTDNLLAVLVLHCLAVAHYDRGWDWRPSPAEFEATAERAARYLIDPRYRAKRLV